MRAPAQVDLQEDLSVGPLRAYQVTTNNRNICWMYDCTVGGWCCMVY